MMLNDLSHTEIPNLEGQLQRLKERGLDPANARICAPSPGTKGHVKGIAGCQQYHRCPFHRREYGALKHRAAPFNVPYFIDARDGLDHATEMFVPCYLYVRNLLPRAKAGLEAREEGLDGEIIEIIAEDGKLAEEVVMTGFVKTSPPNVLPEVYERQDTPTPVPPYKYPSEMANKAVSKVRERREQRIRRDPANTEQSFEETVPTRPRRGRPPKDGTEWKDDTTSQP